MKLSKSINKIAPINSVEKLKELMSILISRNTCISSNIYSTIMDLTDPSMYEPVEQAIQVYKKNYDTKSQSVKKEPYQVKNRPKARKKAKTKATVGLRGLSPNDPINKQRLIERLNSQSSSNSLRDQGYEYGLSDW